MNDDLITATRRNYFKSLVYVGAYVLVSFIMVALPPPIKAQIFDSVIQGALANFCAGLTPGPVGPNLGTICQPPPAESTNIGPSGGSVTAQTREGLPVEDRKIRRRVGALDLFLASEYETFNKDVTTFEPGYTSDTWKGTIGADYSFSGDRFLLGGAFNYNDVTGNFRSGGRFKTSSYGPLIYGTFVPAPSSFIQAATGYTRKDYSIDRRVSYTQSDNTTGVITKSVTGTASGNSNGNEFTIGANGGYNFIFANFTIGPRLGLNYKHTKIDGFRERGSTGLELIYEGQRENSLTSVLGIHGSAAISTAFGVLVPQISAEHVHEFQDDQRRIDFSFVEDLPPARKRFRFQTDSPDRNYFNVGVGVVAVLPQGLSPFVNYRALLGYKDQSSHSVVFGIRFEL